MDTFFEKKFKLLQLHYTIYKYISLDDKAVGKEFTTQIITCQFADDGVARANKPWKLFSVEVSNSDQSLLGDYSVEISSFEVYDENSDEVQIDTIKSLPIKIHSIFVSSINIVGNSECIGTASYSVNVLPQDAYDKTVVWSVDDESIATIDQAGVLTAVGDGTVTIMATANDGSGVYATKKVSVHKHNLKVKSITIVGDSEVKGKATYTTDITPNYAENKTVEWSVSDASLATIDGEGNLVALKSGTVNVIATATDGSGVSSTKEVTLIPYNTITTLKSNVGYWDKEYTPFTFDYTIYVPTETTQVKLTSTFTSGTVKLNGSSVCINKIAKTVTLGGEENDITLVRAGVDGTVDSTYNIKIIVGDVQVDKTINDSAITLKLFSCVDKNATVYCAEYDVSGRLTDCALKPIALTIGSASTVEFDGITEGQACKIFVLDDNMAPLTE